MLNQRTERGIGLGNPARRTDSNTVYSQEDLDPGPIQKRLALHMSSFAIPRFPLHVLNGVHRLQIVEGLDLVLELLGERAEGGQ